MKGPGVWGRSLTALSVLLFLFHVYVLVGFALMAGSHLLPLADILFFAGPIVCLSAVVVTSWKPTQRSAAISNAVMMLIYFIFWIPQIPHLRWVGWQ
jgi:hypothetical protein